MPSSNTIRVVGFCERVFNELTTSLIFATESTVTPYICVTGSGVGVGTGVGVGVGVGTGFGSGVGVGVGVCETVGVPDVVGVVGSSSGVELDVWLLDPGVAVESSLQEKDDKVISNSKETTRFFFVLFLFCIVLRE